MIIGLGVVGSLVRQEPNNSVYLAPFCLRLVKFPRITRHFGWDITRKTVLTAKLFARPCIVIRGLVVFIKKRSSKLSNSDKVDSTS